jgi:uncharacterized protein YjbI with pentapeptide repeats
MATDNVNARENLNSATNEVVAPDNEALLENDAAVDRCPPGVKTYFILRESEANAERVQLLQKIEMPVKEQGASEVMPKLRYIEVEGAYFPDLLVEDGWYLVSAPLFDYLEYKFDSVPAAPYRIALVGEAGKRIEEYALLLPEEWDCVVAASAVYNDQQVLEYFELDPAKVGVAEIFKVKDFPHLLVAAKLNRIEFAGVQCTRIDQYFDYSGRQARLQEEQLNAEQPEQLLQRMEAAVTGRDNACVREFKTVLNGSTLQWDFNRGLRAILESFRRRPRTDLEFGSDRIELQWSWERATCELNRDREFFGVTGFEMKYLAELKEVWRQLPEAMRPDGRKLCFHKVEAAAGKAAAMSRRFDRIHGNHRFGFYLREAAEPAQEPFLIYEYQGQPLAERGPANESGGGGFDNRDWREANFSGRNLAGLKIRGSNFYRVKFHGSQLPGVEFQDCDLSGAEFNNADLSGAKFDGCNLDRAVFDQTKLKEATITGCGLEHTGFVKSNLTGVKLTADGLFGTFFYRSRLIKAVFSVPGAITGCVFRLCDLRQAEFIGDKRVFDNNLEDCDFRNSDLSDCRIVTRGVARCKLVKVKLVCADFSQCKVIKDCDWRWSDCKGMNLDGVWVSGSNFTFVDFSQLQPKSGAVFYGNDFSYTNFTGYNFGVETVLIGDRLINTNLTDCNLPAAWLNDAMLQYPELHGANLQGAHLTAEQLKWVNLSDKQLRSIKLYQDDENFETVKEG